MIKSKPSYCHIKILTRAAKPLQLSMWEIKKKKKSKGSDFKVEESIHISVEAH